MSRTTTLQDEDFMDRLLEGLSLYGVKLAIKDLLEGDTDWILNWVSNNFAPEVVYDEVALAKWALSNGFSTNQKG